jgi:hypothetical protein
VPTCLFAVLLQDNDHRVLFALPHKSQPLCLLLHLSFQTLTTPTPSIAPCEKQHRRSLRKARAWTRNRARLMPMNTSKTL